MDYNNIFSKKLNELRDNGTYRHFLEVNKSATHFPHFHYRNNEGVQRSAINWCSNDYLCMSINEDVIAKLTAVTHRSGAGSSGTRNISGTTVYHKELENTLANWHKKEAALLFNGAYQANVTALPLSDASILKYLRYQALSKIGRPPVRKLYSGLNGPSIAQSCGNANLRQSASLYLISDANESVVFLKSQFWLKDCFFLKEF